MCSSKKRNGGFFPPSTTLFFHSFFLIVFCLFALFEFFSIQRLLVPRWGRGGRFVWLMKAFWGKQVDFYFVVVSAVVAVVSLSLALHKSPQCLRVQGGSPGPLLSPSIPFVHPPPFFFLPDASLNFTPTPFTPSRISGYGLVSLHSALSPPAFCRGASEARR